MQRFLLGLAIAAAYGTSTWAQDPDVLTRGPVHEAYAEPVVFDPEPGVIVAAEPPEPVREMPPDQQPVGEDVQWIPGYWAFDEERNDFLWVSGLWRDIPPGRQWVPGYWAAVEGGARWVSGFWAPLGGEGDDQVVEAQDASLEYIPEAPPQTLEAGPNVPAPAPAGYFWAPGSWYWGESEYLWRPGVWVEVRTEWVWVPSCYMYTPSGFVFVEGYWDFPVARRGLCFAPVYFAPPARRVEVVYTPVISIVADALLSNLFCRRNTQNYYFGDYYDNSYQQAGYQSWTTFHTSTVGTRRIGFDPIYNYYSTSRVEVHREVVFTSRAAYIERRDHIDLRPARTYAAQLLVDRDLEIRRGNGQISRELTINRDVEINGVTRNVTLNRNVTLVRPLTQVVQQRNDGFRAVAREQRDLLAQRNDQLRDLQRERGKLERDNAVLKGRLVETRQAARIKLPTSPMSSPVATASANANPTVNVNVQNVLPGRGPGRGQARAAAPPPSPERRPARGQRANAAANANRARPDAGAEADQPGANRPDRPNAKAQPRVEGDMPKRQPRPEADTPKRQPRPNVDVPKRQPRRDEDTPKKGDRPERDEDTPKKGGRPDRDEDTPKKGGRPDRDEDTPKKGEAPPPETDNVPAPVPTRDATAIDPTPQPRNDANPRVGQPGTRTRNDLPGIGGPRNPNPRAGAAARNVPPRNDLPGARPGAAANDRRPNSTPRADAVPPRVRSNANDLPRRVPNSADRPRVDPGSGPVNRPALRPGIPGERPGRTGNFDPDRRSSVPGLPPTRPGAGNANTPRPDIEDRRPAPGRAGLRPNPNGMDTRPGPGGNRPGAAANRGTGGNNLGPRPGLNPDRRPSAGFGDDRPRGGVGADRPRTGNGGAGARSLPGNDDSPRIPDIRRPAAPGAGDRPNADRPKADRPSGARPRGDDTPPPRGENRRRPRGDGDNDDN